ncbi:MAG: alpha-amylase family glycosyl hydrolase [Ancrocorticia sp.]
MTVKQTNKWWKDAVVYQVYPRSFADADGDGNGDINGIREHLGYLKDLEVDAIWVNPWYRSPQVDAGYDVADFRDIDPLYGTLEDAEHLINEAHELGLRVIVDIVPNHTSDQHRWFQEALVAGPGSPERSRYWFRPGKGEHGELPPNNWPSQMGGPAWTRVTEPDGAPGEWYLHLFTPEQPDLNWDSREVRDEFLDILRFWFDRGADGFRIDVAMALAKDPDLPDYTVNEDGTLQGAVGTIDVHPHFDRDEVQDIFREWRTVADSYAEDKVFVAEAWVMDSERYQRYLADGVLHTAFNFGFLICNWDAGQFRDSITKSLNDHASLDGPPSWVLSNHDVVRHLSRYGHRELSVAGTSQQYSTPFDLELGTRRARAAAFLTLGLPGGAYIYQGEELGLWEVEDIPDDRLMDPQWERTNHQIRGRDGCRVPLPWAGEGSPFEFSPSNASAEPWLPQPAEWKHYTVEDQQPNPGSMLRLYRRLLEIRRINSAWSGTSFEWIAVDPNVVAFRRGSFVCLVNCGEEPVSYSSGGVVLASSNGYDGSILPGDSAVWIQE